MNTPDYPYCDRHREHGAYDKESGYFIHTDGEKCDSTFVTGPPPSTPTFTAVIKNKVGINLASYSIDRLVAHVKDTLLDEAPRGSKCKTEHSLIENTEGQKYACVTISLLNIRNRVVDTALVWGEQPLEPGRRYHANSRPTDFISCSTCGGAEFYDVGRDRFYFRHICAKCGAGAATLTETGACT